MTPTDFTAAIRALGMSQRRLGRLLGLDHNTANRWATGASPVPQAVALLLKAWAQHPELIPAEPETA